MATAAKQDDLVVRRLLALDDLLKILQGRYDSGDMSHAEAESIERIGWKHDVNLIYLDSPRRTR